MSYCVVYGCPNTNPATADPSVHYYQFPKHPLLAQQWVTACGWQESEIDISSARLCSTHFDADCYTTEIKVVDFITCYSKVLKFDAIPTLFLPAMTTTAILLKTDSEGELLVLCDGSLEKEYIELQVETTEDAALGQSSEAVARAKYQHIQTEEQLLELQTQNKKLRDALKSREKKLKTLKTNLDKAVDEFKNKDLEMSRLHREYLRKKRSFLSLQQQRALLSRVFSEPQIKILCGKKKIYWSDNDMAVGYTIRQLSNKRCYMYLTKRLNIPLPAISSIKRWMTLKKKKAPPALRSEDECSNKSNE